MEPSGNGDSKSGFIAHVAEHDWRDAKIKRLDQRFTRFPLRNRHLDQIEMCAIRYPFRSRRQQPLFLLHMREVIAMTFVLSPEQAGLS